MKDPIADVLLADTLCARALRWLALQPASVDQTALVARFRALGGKAAFTFAFGRFCENGSYARTGYQWIRRAPHPSRAGRYKTSPWSRAYVPVSGRNVVSWCGPDPVDAVASLSDAALQACYERAERQATADRAGEADDVAWHALLGAEIVRRLGAIYVAVPPHVAIGLSA